MKQTTRLLPLLAFLGLLAACGGQHSARETARYAEEGRSVNSVRLIDRHQQVISFGRLSGGQPQRITELKPITQLVWPDQGSIRFHVATGLFQANQVTWIRDEMERSAEVIPAALGPLIATYSAFDEIAINLDIVLAPDQSGAYYESRSPIARSATISILYPLPDQALEWTSTDLMHWWSAMTANIAHELYHLHHDLSGLGALQINEETAASLIENCALLRYGEAIDAHPSIDVSWILDDPNTWRAFPLLGEGELAPNEEALRDDFPLISMRGRFLASAVLYLLSENGTINGDDAAQRSMMLSYCESLTQSVPDFMAGEI